MTHRPAAHKVCHGRQSRNQAGVTMFGLCPESWSPSSLASVPNLVEACNSVISQLLGSALFIP